MLLGPRCWGELREVDLNFIAESLWPDVEGPGTPWL